MSRVLVLGGTGTIGRATTATLLSRGHDVVCVVRAAPADLPARASVRVGGLGDLGAAARDGIRGERFDAIVSCMASRTGAPRDAWAIDYRAHADALAAAKAAGIPHMVLLSAICVQKPRLAFQHAKLAFEAVLIGSGLAYSIVRPTAFFKSLSGQVERVKQGKPFLVFGDGTLTACKPISDRDLAAFIVDCLDDPARRNRILPIGGPGPALTPRDQAEHLFALLKTKPRIRHLPVALLDAVVATLGVLAPVSSSVAVKAELARIGRYYATESMLVRDEATGRYDADATPSTGTETLLDHYARLVRGEAMHQRGAQSVF